ncbi:MAG: hypothetical protein R3C44_06390 [Chloroflexota bacterium]
MDDLIKVYEVGPRDGLQNEATLLETADKLALIDRLVQSGLRHIEATSFVHPKAVPQLADAGCGDVSNRREASRSGSPVHWAGL